MNVVLLNGPAGVGKTTVGRRLAGTAPNGACVHGDDLKHFVVTREEGAVQQGLSYVGGATLVDVFLDAGYDLVVFEFIFTKAAHVSRFLGALRSNVAVHLITLWAPIAVVRERERLRADRERLGPRVAECWHELTANLAELGVVVDASASVDEVVGEVRRRVESGAALAA
jgi:chloramphenicol 3-O-phosphotransferase